MQHVGSLNLPNIIMYLPECLLCYDVDVHLGIRWNPRFRHYLFHLQCDVLGPNTPYLGKSFGIFLHDRKKYSQMVLENPDYTLSASYRVHCYLHLLLGASSDSQNGVPKWGSEGRGQVSLFLHDLKFNRVCFCRALAWLDALAVSSQAGLLSIIRLYDPLLLEIFLPVSCVNKIFGHSVFDEDLALSRNSADESDIELVMGEISESRSIGTVRKGTSGGLSRGLSGLSGGLSGLSGGLSPPKETAIKSFAGVSSDLRAQFGVCLLSGTKTVSLCSDIVLFVCLGFISKLHQVFLKLLCWTLVQETWIMLTTCQRSMKILATLGIEELQRFFPSAPWKRRFHMYMF
jgi:hypothetical protein